MQGDLFSLGALVLDVPARRLSCNGVPVRLTQIQLSILIALVEGAGELVPREVLFDAAWHGRAVELNNLTQAMRPLREVLAQYAPGLQIQTHHRRGYRLIGAVTKHERPASASSIEDRLAPYRAFVEGRAALESLDAKAIARARLVFEDTVRQTPRQASAHVGLANACVLQFEMTRTDAQPDVESLKRGALHARHACELDERYGEAYATLGFALERVGPFSGNPGWREDALAALRLAVDLEPDNWRHHLRLGAASWGEERLRAARRTLQLMPGLALAHWLAASVLVARQLLTEADRELTLGLHSACSESATKRFSGIALHLLRGLIALAQGDPARAMDEFDQELRGEHGGHLYARECAANTWYAIGATRLRQGDDEHAQTAFEESLRRVPTHPFALAALSRPFASPRLGEIDTAMATLVSVVKGDRASVPDDAVALLTRTLDSAPPGNGGWLLAVEPMLAVADASASWAPALAAIRARSI